MSTLLPPKASVARDQILSLIREGKFRPGQCLPSERELAAQFGMDQRTIRRGLADLTKAGLIIKRPRVGNFVQDPHADSPVMQVALILPHWITRQPGQHPLIGTFWNGVTQVFDQRNVGEQVHLLDYQLRGNLWQDAGQIAERRGVRGAIIYSYLRLTADQVQPLLKAGIKLVTVMDSNDELDRLGIPNVNFNEKAVLRQAAHRLKELGHRHVGMVKHFDGREVRAQVEASIEAIWRECGFLYDAHTIIAPEVYKPGLDPAPIRRALSRASRPTALITHDDALATGVFQCCYELGLNVPRDLSLVAIHDHVPQSHAVSLSAPDTPDVLCRIAKRAATILRQMLSNDPPDDRAVMVGCDIQWKDSVAAISPVAARRRRGKEGA